VSASTVGEPDPQWKPARKDVALEDIRFMADQGETLEGVVARLAELRGRPLTPDGLRRFLQRWNAADVLYQLTRYEQQDPPDDLIHDDWWKNTIHGRPLTPEEQQQNRRELAELIRRTNEKSTRRRAVPGAHAPVAAYSSAVTGVRV
jgi:hypothetical protein